MARIAGINLPAEKRIEAALPYIYGIGLSKSQGVLRQAKVNPDTRVINLSDEQANKLRELIEKQNKVEGDLKRDIFSNIVAKRRLDTDNSGKNSHRGG